jgi:thioredoxin-dependent peroxiredoxin
MSQSVTYNPKYSLKSAKGGRTVLYFYPRDNTSGCSLEAQDFASHLKEFTKLGARVVGVSQDSLASHEKFRAKYSLPFELVSDPEGDLCGKFEVIKMKSLYGRKFKGIERSTFVLDAKGKVLREWRKVKVKGHVEEVLAFLRGEEE